MKFVLLGFIFVYVCVVVYIYVTQDSKVFNPNLIENREPISLKNSERLSLKVEDGVVLDGIYKKAEQENTPLIIYFGGNADDSTRILLHVKSLKDFDIVSFNYRGFAKSGGKPSEKALFSDALKVYDEFAKDKPIILIGRSLGTGVATFLASKRDVDGLILITPYDSIASIGQKIYPYLPVKLLSKHKFESVRYMLDVKAPVGLIEVQDDETIDKYHFDKLMDKVPNLALHVELKDTTHGDVLTHSDFETSIKDMIKRFEIGKQ